MSSYNNQNHQNIIPDKYFEDVLSIWDVFICYADIVSEILAKKDSDENSECFI